ncbi:ribosome 60S biogenesis N-terminal-domain-containing protein [Leucosporidium creatinivorum]|uniref:Ribosome 60S biogenesis N-terminal-domain-containing protein n=1 Tax=Leucosporidium creatinivorum TaxID=106004 RepID=A0A1Y2CK02_9BASI|nr:ribosome 60S biogenesis N-terminal-domain-containing protein [Leucosporidium creatinivorum]
MAPYEDHEEEGRPTASLPQRSTGTIKLPLIAPFSAPEEIVQALATRDIPLLTAALLQVEKRASALVAKAAPRAQADPLLDYLTKYPTADGLFTAWDTAHKTNNSQLSAAVLTALTALVRLVSTDPFTNEPEVIRRLLTQYGSHLDRALNPGRNDVTVAALKLCNVVVGFGSGRFARRLFGSMQWQPKIITRLFRTRLKDTSRDPLLRPDIRTLLSMLVLAFLAAGDSKLKTQVIETKGLISGVVKGLSEDPEVIINHVLVSLHRDIVADRSVGLEARRSVFDEPCIVELLKLYDVEDGDIVEQSPRVSIHRFLYALTEWLAKQINDSQARSFGPQKVLGTVLRTLKVTEESQQRELGLHILGRAPILAGAFWARFPSSLDPRLSSRWISAITFATQVVALPVTQHLSPSSTPPTLTALLDNVLPPSLNKTWYSKALQHENGLVSFLSSIFILAVMQKAAKILETIAETSSKLEEVAGSGRWASLAARMREHLRTVLPDPQIVVALMQKTAVAAPPPAASSKSKSKSSKKVKEVEPAAETKEEDEASRHLRTNVALRLLWLYHRVVPSLIATLRFDFAKLPQAHVTRSDAEGIRAISSAYALRLAAIHSASLTWSRPGDHFKTTLLPLFQLYRTPSTPSNRHLLLTILGRLLTTPILFGESSQEVEVWLAALPTPSQDPSTTDGASLVLDFFERCVQQTLTAPIKAAAVQEGASTAPTFSPLLATVLKGLAAQVNEASGVAVRPLLAFLRRAFYGVVGQSQSTELPKALASALKKELGDIKVAKSTLKLLKDCVKALEEQVEPQADEKLKQLIENGEDLSALNPIKENVFASFSEDVEALQAALASMPIELVLLHVRPSDLRNEEVSASLVKLVVAKASWSSAVQTLLHRFVGAPWTEEDRLALAAFIQSLYQSTTDQRVQRKLKEATFGAEGLLKVFTEGAADATPYAGIATLLGSLLSPSSKQDAVLAQPFCALVVADLAAVKSKSKKSSKSASLSPRLESGAALLSFFDDNASLAFLDALLIKTSVNNVAELDSSTKALLAAALSRAASLPTSADFRSAWTSHFVLLHRLSTQGGVEAAGRVLVRGAQALLPFVVSAAPGEAAALPFTGFRHGSNDIAWRERATEWTSELLSVSSLGLDQSQVLATLIYRSPETRSQFVEWIKARSSEGEDVVDGSEAALKALLEVAEVQGKPSEVPDSIALHFTRRLFAETALATASALDSLRLVQLMCAESPSTAAVVNTLLEEHLPTIDRDAFTPSILRLVSDLAQASPIFNETLNAYVNASFAGLVRHFAEVDELPEAVVLLIQELQNVATRHLTLVYKSHLLEPLITAATTYRLGKADVTTLAATLCQAHEWKSNEVTRHLNEVFASSDFRPRPLTDAATRKAQSAIIRLVIALSTSSIQAAASSRVLEKLMPFYGGTLSADDAALVDLFQRIEIVSGASISIAFRSWNPALDDSPLESSRAASLGLVQSGYVRRAWLRVCASSRTTFPKEHAEITYDPHFLLPFVAHTIAEDELKAADWTTILESGVLAVVVAALGSSSDSTRLVARGALKTALVKLEALTFREKDEIVLILTQARNCIYSSAGEAIPSVIALFLANCMHIIGTPESTLYPAFTRFLLQRPILDQRDVPMFYLLFYTTSDEPVEDHRWLLRFLAEGLVRSQDWKIYRRRQTFELLASLLQTSKQDPASRKLVLQFLLRATSIPQAARELLSRNGLLGWISAQTAVDPAERRLLISILSNLVDVLSNDKLSVVADALDALSFSSGSNEVAAIELSAICQIVTKLSLRLPSAVSPSPAHTLVLDRARSLLTFVAARLPATDLKVQGDLYSATMAVSFTRFSAGLEETRMDKELYNAGVAAGLVAGVEQLKVETLRSLAGN